MDSRDIPVWRKEQGGAQGADFSMLLSTKITEMNLIRISVWDGRSSVSELRSHLAWRAPGESGSGRLQPCQAPWTPVLLVWACAAPALLIPPPRPGQVMSPRVGLLWGYSILCLFSYLASLLFQPLPRYTRE